MLGAIGASYFHSCQFQTHMPSKQKRVPNFLIMPVGCQSQQAVASHGYTFTSVVLLIYIGRVAHVAWWCTICYEQNHAPDPIQTPTPTLWDYVSPELRGQGPVPAAAAASPPSNVQPCGVRLVENQAAVERTDSPRPSWAEMSPAPPTPPVYLGLG
eukprot:1551799-Amphidinium_carterae.1